MSRVLYVLLTIVAAAAAVLSFSALRDLAAACGFSRQLAWLLPVVVDAGAAAGSVVWLGGSGVPDRARRFARVLALALLIASVAANALGHVLAAYQLQPHWAVVVGVSAVAPAVLGAVVHLAVLVAGESARTGGQARTGPTQTAVPLAPDVEAPSRLGHAQVSELHPVPPAGAPGLPPAGEQAGEREPDRVAQLIAAGAGRRRLARELDISEHEARLLLDRGRNGHGIEASA